MFSINPKPTFTAEADIPLAGGGTEKLQLVFKHKTRDEVKAFFEHVSAGADDQSDADVLLEIVAGWEDVDVPFSREALDQLVQNYPSAPRAIFDTYLGELTGQRRGN
ncbi:phage tail assembly chaperone [Ralstonia pseudosolanacearum]|uniref:phage tail assembly chaperone n=1 Tax=Ralstonia pseudosolanacearum TaxID=1310165 RepID=UPI001FF9AEFE|nr:phage tail assembly chaperone [Ralstonia pseudosolanacearum]